MKKTINVSLGGLNFSLEEDAYERLDRYLKEVRGHFASYQEADEIINDIESRFAEQFSSKAGGSQAVTLAEVEKVIAQMGSPDQFGDQPAAPPSPAEPARRAGPRRLYRDTDNVIIAGVCSGLAAYIGVDPVWVRLLFFVSILAGGTGALIYILLWIIVPEAKTDTEKMEMRGEPITLKNLEQTVKEKVLDAQKNNSKAKEAAAAPIKVFGRIIRAFALVLAGLLKALAKIIGALIVAAGVFGAAMLVFLTVTALFNSNSPYVDLPLSALAHNPLYYAGLVAAFVAIFLPLVALVILGISIVSSRSVFGKIAGFSLLGVWIVAAAAAANIGIRLAPQVEQAVNNSPEYQVVTRNLDLKDFSKIEIGGANIAEVKQADTFQVTVEGRQHDLDNTEFTVRNGTLVDRYNKTKICFFCIERPLRLTITAPALEGVNGSGGTKITAEGFKSQNFKVNLSGASQATIRAEAVNISADLSGASRLNLAGTTTTLSVKETGSSRATALQMAFATPNNSPASSAVTASLSGGSHLELAGNPERGSFTLSGASQVEAAQTTLRSATADLSGASRLWLGDVTALKASASGASKVYYRSVKQLERADTSGSGKIEQNGNPGLRGTDFEYEYMPAQPELQ